MTKRTQLTIAGILIILIGVVLLLGWGLARGTFSLIPSGTPDLNRELTFSTNFPEESREAYIERYKENINALKADPTNVEVWYDVAIQFKTAGDIDAAVEIWEYLASTYQYEGIALHNLGAHHLYETKDYDRAEEFFRKSIEVQPAIAQNYLDLHDMYRYVYKQDTTAAVDVLKEGIAKLDFAQAIDLKVLLARYYLEKGDIANARLYYTEARDNARELGNSNLVRKLNEELSRLR